MNILQDLDRQNTKIPGRVAAEGCNRLAWVLVPIFVVIGVTWLFLTLHSGSTDLRPQSPQQGNNKEIISPLTEAKSQSEEQPAFPVPAKSDVPPPVPAQEKAIIRATYEEQEAPGSGNRTAPDTSHPLLPETSNQKISVTSQKQFLRKEAKSTPSAKAGKALATKPESDGAQAAKKAAERDIDIITAIVK